jgi:AmmeMemoRadiSam system protein B
MFYPGERGELSAQITGFLAKAAEQSAPGRPPKALIAPHAGTIYSGPVAASAYARLIPARDGIERVVLLGPAHRVALRGLGATSADAWETPLGRVPIDRVTLDRLLELPQVRVNDGLEVHLPFLQLVLADFQLVPLVVGSASAEEVAEVLEACWGGDETLVVVSSDLSHYHDYATARALDRRTTLQIEALAVEELDGDGACGFYPVRGLLLHARRHGLAVRNIDLRNSGDTAGSRREVVGYGSYVVA